MELVSERQACIQLGNRVFVIVSDGPLNVGPVSDVLAHAPDRSGALPEVQEMVLAQNALALQTTAGWAVFETGVGSLDDREGAGKLSLGLAAAGIDPADVTALVPSHAHLDHVGGIMSRDGERNFPNAAIHMDETELTFWLDDERLGTPRERSARVARANLLPNLDRIAFHRDKSEFLEGVHAMRTPGHTLGHSSFLISSGHDRLFIAGDLAHCELQIEHPTIATKFDIDPDMATTSRLHMLDFLCSTRTLALFYHFAWPGLGYVEKANGGFRFIPVATAR